MTASTVECPQCGGENRLPSGERRITCGWCDAAIFVDRGAAVSHYWLPWLLDREQAQAALRRWMAGNETVKDLDRKSDLRDAERLYFPLWMFRVEGPGGGRVFVEPAAPTPIPQLADLEIPAGELRPAPPADATAPEVPVSVPVETARDWLAERGFRETTESSLVRLPLWRCRYDYHGAGYEALVDGSTGSVMAAIYPEKAESPYYLTAAVGIVLFLAEGLLIQNPIAKLAAFAITGLPLALVAYLVTRKV